MAPAAAESKAPGERRLQRLELPLVAFTLVADEVGGDRAFEAVILREGVFTPGLGNPEGDRLFFPRSLLKRFAEAGGEGLPVNLEHSHMVEDEIGVMSQLRMDADEERLRASLILQKKRPRFGDALGFVTSRIDARQVPNVSVELVNLILRPAPPEKKAEWDLEVVDATLVGCAILTVGACSDKAGCGIGLRGQRTHSQSCASSARQPGANTMPGEDCKCGGKPAADASLQARVSDLEKALEAKTKEAETLTQRVAGFEAAEVQALREAVQAIAPPGTDLKALVGDNPSKGELAVALKALQVAKPAAIAMGGRKTNDTSRDTEPAKVNQDHLVAMRAKLGLAEKSPLPGQLQRNSAKLLKAAPAEVKQ